MQQFEIYTDGSHKGAWGSWAFLIVRDGVVICEASGRIRNTTHSRMEYQAVIEALRFFDTKIQATIYTDSRDLIEKTEQFGELKSNGWRRKGRLIANADQFITLDDLIQLQAVTFRWVKAHAGHKYNERCDELCVLARSS